MATRDDVLGALRTAGGSVLSGESLARELGVSRVAVGKHVASLREAGYEIAAVPGRGYALVSVPDAPLPAEVTPLLREAAWMRLEGGGETGSTNDDARALARVGAQEGAVVLASRQRTGRGRLGRTWLSPAGGVYLSVVLRPRVPPSSVASLALAVALGVARGLAELGASARLKWPNDVLLGGGKVAGILLEMGAEADRVDWVVAGVGLNVRRAQGQRQGSGEPAGPADASYLEEATPQVRIPVAAAAVLDGIAAAYREWCTGGFAALMPEYESRLALVGSSVSVRDLSGIVRAEGVVEGVDEDGRLLVRSERGVERVVAGDVTLRG